MMYSEHWLQNSTREELTEELNNLIEGIREITNELNEREAM